MILEVQMITSKVKYKFSHSPANPVILHHTPLRDSQLSTIEVDAIFFLSAADCLEVDSSGGHKCPTLKERM